MNIRCLFGLHYPKRVGSIAPIKQVSDWSEHYMGHWAMGRCRRCKKLEMRRHYAPRQARNRRLGLVTFKEYNDEYGHEWKDD